MSVHIVVADVSTQRSDGWALLLPGFSHPVAVSVFKQLQEPGEPVLGIPRLGIPRDLGMAGNEVFYEVGWFIFVR